MDVVSKEGQPLRAISPDDDHHTRKRRRKRFICFSVIAVILAVVLLIVILAVTVFKAKRPVTTVDSVALRNFAVSLDIPRIRVLLNVSLDVDLSIKNPNKVGFKYGNSSAYLQYRGQEVGEVPIPAGKIGADGTTNMNLTLNVMADRLLTDSNVYSDVLNGTLPFTSTTRIAGKVRILNLFNIHVVSYTTCDVNVDVSSRSVRDQTCEYKTKL